MLRTLDIMKSRGFSFKDDPGGLIQNDEVALSWGDYFERGSDDMKTDMDRAIAAVSSNLLSQESAVRYVASDFAIEDVQAEMDRIKAESESRVTAFSDNSGG
jgi:hypothetical protein